MKTYALLAALLASNAMACDVTLTWSEPVQDPGVIIGKISGYNVMRCLKADCSDAAYLKQTAALTYIDIGRVGAAYYYVQRITDKPDQSSNIVFKSCPKAPVLS